MEKIQREGTWKLPLLHNWQHIFFLKRNSSNMIILLLFSCDQDFHRHFSCKGWTNTKVGAFWTTWILCAQQLKIWWCSILTKISHTAASDIQLFSNQLQLVDWQQYELYPAVLQTLVNATQCQECILVLGHGAPATRVSKLTTEELEIWLCSILLSFQLKIIGLLENQDQESPHKSLLFHGLIGNKIGTASTSFL